MYEKCKMAVKAHTFIYKRGDGEWGQIKHKFRQVLSPMINLVYSTFGFSKRGLKAQVFT